MFWSLENQSLGAWGRRERETPKPGFREKKNKIKDIVRLQIKKWTKPGVWDKRRLLWEAYGCCTFQYACLCWKQGLRDRHRASPRPVWPPSLLIWESSALVSQTRVAKPVSSEEGKTPLEGDSICSAYLSNGIIPLQTAKQTVQGKTDTPLPCSPKS